MLQGLFEFRFQLVYTSLEEQLVRIKELWDLALRQKGKERDAQNSAKQRLSAIIQARTASFHMRCTSLKLQVSHRTSLINVICLSANTHARHLADSRACMW